MKTSAIALAVAVLWCAGFLAGCGRDRAAEFFDEQERQEREKAEGTKPAPAAPEVDLKTLITPKPVQDDSIPPPILVDVRTLREDYQDGTIRVERSVRYFSDGSTVNHGPYTAWHPNGKKHYEGRYEDGKRVGEWTYYMDDGVKTKSGTYKDGQLDGVWTFWLPGKPEQLSRREEYRKGARHGKWTYWDAEGRKLREESYAANEPDGEWTEWHPNGKPKSQVHFKQGKRDGKAVTWDEQGRKTSEMLFRNDVVVDRGPSAGAK